MSSVATTERVERRWRGGTKRGWKREEEKRGEEDGEFERYVRRFYTLRRRAQRTLRARGVFHASPASTQHERMRRRDWERW